MAAMGSLAGVLTGLFGQGRNSRRGARADRSVGHDVLRKPYFFDMSF